MKTETFGQALDSHARQIRLDMARSITEADRIIADEIADPAAELARILFVAANSSSALPYPAACRDIGAQVLGRLQEIIDGRAERLAEVERK